MRLASVVVLAILLVMTGCAPAPSAPPATATARPAGLATPAIVPSPSSSVPILPGGVGVAGPAVTSVPLPGATPQGPKLLVSPAEVTLADLIPGNQATIQLDAGQRFLLNLDSNSFYDWTIDVADGTILRRAGDQAQGLYEAGRPGRTTLVARGDPRCLQARPRCAAPSIMLTLQILVR